MKFVDFGDLVEVTYDDDNIELISKYDAVEKLGYKQGRTLLITYHLQIFELRQFCIDKKIDYTKAYNFYSKGIRKGEILLQKCKAKPIVVKITYQGKVFNASQFAKLADISQQTVLKYYKQGLTTGEEIIYTYQQSILENQQQYNCVFYNENAYSCSAFARLTGISEGTIMQYYRKGIHNGQEMIDTYNKNSNFHKTKEKRKIPYKGKYYTVKEFSKLTCMTDGTIYNYLNHKNCRTGEEMIRLYESQKDMGSPKSKVKRTIITYNGKEYSAAEFSTLTNISDSTICRYCRQGITSGEEILRLYAQNKRCGWR